MVESAPDNPYSRLNYRRLIAWPERIEREAPFLEQELRRAPAPVVVDLGCGTGEHARHLASRGFSVFGIDRSPEQIETARDFEEEFGMHGPRFLCGELTELDRLTAERFGAAICLGNVLPHLDDEEWGRALAALARRLRTRGRLVIQLVNYERIFLRGDRHLPINVREDPASSGEIVFLRLMKTDGDRHVLFFPSTLLLHPGEDPPLSVQAAKEVRLRAWRLPDLEALLGSHGFTVDGAFGDMKRASFVPEASTDLVVTAVFEGPTSDGSPVPEGGVEHENRR